MRPWIAEYLEPMTHEFGGLNLSSRERIFRPPADRELV